MFYLTRGSIIFVCLILFLTARMGCPYADTITELVMLPVMVTDQHNHSVKQLQVTDFRVLDEGAPQMIAFFSSGDVPLSYVLAIDSSGSMRKLIPDMKMMAKKLINSNKPDDEMCLIRFSTGDDIQLVQDWTKDKKIVIDAIENIQFRGGSSILDGLTSAVGYAKKHRDTDSSIDRRKAVIVITDGLERDSIARKEDVLKHFSDMGIQVYAIGLISQLDQRESIFQKKPETYISTKTLGDVAAVTGGFAFFPKKDPQLTESTDALIEMLHWRYMIAYALPENRKNSFHKVEIRVPELSAKGKYTITTLPGYFLAGK
jgi:Ca-activated chloride channel family protein